MIHYSGKIFPMPKHHAIKAGTGPGGKVTFHVVATLLPGKELVALTGKAGWALELVWM